MITAAVVTFGILLLAWLAAPGDPVATDVAPAADEAPLAEAASPAPAQEPVVTA